MKTIATTISLMALAVSAAAQAKDKPMAVATCATSYGSLAFADGDVQGWARFGLDSPRELLGAMVRESGCFTIHDPASGEPADYLLIASAGAAQETEQGLIAGLGNRKRAVSTHLQLAIAATGMTVLTAGAEARKTSLSWGSIDGHGGSAAGKLLATSFLTAYNGLVAQTGALSTKP
jgi:hypothetical protein